MDSNCFTVGELSEITGVSKQAIRYYDRIGLLKPGRLGENAYRYYGPMHILYLNSIMRLTQLGCSLEETRRYLAGQDIGNVRHMLAMRRALTENKINEMRCALKAMDEQIQLVDEGISARTYSGVRFKRLPQRYFVYLESGETPDLKHGIMQIGKLVRQLDSCGLLYVGSPVFEIADGALRTGYFLKTQPDGFLVDSVPAGEYACIAHRGAYADMGRTLNRLKAYVARHHLKMQSGVYQLFLIDFALTHCENELLTELQVKDRKSVV